MMTGRGKTAAALLAALALVGCAGSNLAPSTSAASPGAYRLGTGDELRIHVSGLDAMNNTYFVDDTGAIALPMLAPVTVSGMSVREAEGAIVRQILARQLVLEPRVSAQVLAYRPFFVTGEVQKPGQYAYVPGMSLAMAVTIAGGYTFRANKKAAVLSRGGVSARAGQDMAVLPGDVITVRESWF